MSDLERCKRKVQQVVEHNRDKLISVSTQIHRHPEMGLAEFRAADLLMKESALHGFGVESPAAGLDTAFIARYDSGKPGARVAFLAEYDALPGLGHACGHNLIAAASLGAAVAVREIIGEFGGAVCLYGTPDEEAFGPDSRGGKVIMAAQGLFDELDAALMIHPVGGPHAVWRYTFPLKDFSVCFRGRPAHYTVPHEGINALETLLLFLNNVNTLKRGWTPDVMFAYTITDGGGPSAIVVPERAEAHVTLKAFHQSYLEELYEKVLGCAREAARLTGAEVETRLISAYRNSIPNLNLATGLYRNMRSLGLTVESPVQSQRALERLRYPGISTDFGDVSWKTAGIHAYCSLGDERLVAHTPAFAEAAGSEAGHRALVAAAKALAMTAVDILADGELRARMRSEFERYRRQGFARVPGIPPGYLPFPQDFLSALSLEP